MAVISGVSTEASAASSSKTLWLRDKRWDLLFITFSVVVVPLPYIMYLLGRDMFGLQDDVSRNMVNAFVAIAVGGPHMMSTFLRTGLDNSFKQRYPMLIRSSVIIPIIVISLAFLNLTLLLTVFFFWAAIHVLHQVTYIVELYNKRGERLAQHTTSLQWWARLIDYALVLTCLFPIAALKISQGNFAIGTNDLTRAIPAFFQQTWFFVAASVVFGVAFIAFLIKSYYEWRNGVLHLPKFVFIMITVPVACSMPALENLDTAFQGLNTWHSFQYLALTFYIIQLRHQKGDLAASNPQIDKLASARTPWRLYLFSAMMLGGSIVLGIVVYITVGIVDPLRDLNARFDTAYYTAILCFLWIHYYHDHFLFTDFEAIEREAVA